jgi:hypothetical protein
MWAYQFQDMQNVAERNGWTKFVSMQNHYSLCYREEEREMNAYCHKTGVGLIPWAPLYRGHLARPLGSESTSRNETSKQAGTKMDAESMTEEDREIVKRVQELAEKKGWKMSQVALVCLSLAVLLTGHVMLTIRPRHGSFKEEPFPLLDSAMWLVWMRPLMSRARRSQTRK